jgi:hypothetical protein
MSVGS